MWNYFHVRCFTCYLRISLRYCYSYLCLQPKTQDILIHRTKLQTYHRHYENFFAFELFHMLSVDDQPGGFHPVLPRHITDLEFSGMARFEDVLDFPNRVMNYYRVPCPINWVR